MKIKIKFTTVQFDVPIKVEKEIKEDAPQAEHAIELRLARITIAELIP